LDSIKFIINYRINQKIVREVLWELFFGYDILINKRRKTKVKIPHFPFNKREKLQVDEIVDYEIHENKLKIYVELYTKNLVNIVDFIWIKYILNIIEENVYVDQIEFINVPKKRELRNINKNFIKKIYKMTYNGARGVILKGYSKLYNEWIVNIARELAGKKCYIIKEDETFTGGHHDLKYRLEALSNNNLIYVFNSILINSRFIKPIYNDLISVPLVPYLAQSFSRLTMWSHRGFIVWGHRQGHFLLRRFVSKKVYLKLALLAGAFFLHVGTPRSTQEFKFLKELLEELRKIKPFIPVFTGTPNIEVEQSLLRISDNRAVFLSPRYWEGCD